MDEINKLSFEEALKGLEDTSEALKSDKITLEDALQNFECGMKYYKRCKEILDEAKQKVLVYDRNKGELQDFSS
ncbi:MAG: exodeoxyribonuclease VII small subunit [Clostridiales bacterium]|nr:exodeoxyribonuclease VII small subunit [Clostridiales bacterium]